MRVRQIFEKTINIAQNAGLAEAERLKIFLSKSGILKKEGT
jgi:hypothetical protein